MVTTTTIVRSLVVVAILLSKHGSTESFRYGPSANLSSSLRSKGFYRERIICRSRSFLYPGNHNENHHPKKQNHPQQRQQQLDAHHQKQFPIPAMPSDNFRKMAESQLELLANSLTSLDNPSETKVQSMILYLPQENLYSGQLEFTPAVLYPDPSTERVFIASDAASGQAPTLPKSLSKLPGFSSAPELLPGYPMLPSATDPGVGVVEEVMCDIRFKTSALSIPLLSGSQTVGVLLVSPTVSLTDEVANSEENTSNSKNSSNSKSNSKRKTSWTKRDKEQVSLAAQSLSMALNMDNERNILSEQNAVFRENLSDSLHQMKNPIQALRTYGKILQRQIVETSINNNIGNSNAPDVGGMAQLLELTERLMVQSDRVVDMLGPMDSLVETLDNLPPRNNPSVMLPPAVPTNGVFRRQQQDQSMVLWNSRVATEEPTEQQNDGPTWRNQTIVPEVSGNLQASKYFNATVDEVHFQPSTTPASSSSSSNYNSRANTEGVAASLPAVIGDFETEMVYIPDVLESVFDTFEAIASEQGISFEVVVDEIDDLPGVFVAPKSLREAVSNVLDNALKYAILPKPGSPLDKNPSPKVRVRIFPNEDCCNINDIMIGSCNATQPTQTQTTGVTVLVEDNGPGVAEDDRDQIFRRGFRSDRTASEVEGTGIGLDISKALLARMGGCLDLVCEEHYKSWGLADNGLGGAAMKIEVTRKLYRLAER